MTVQSHFGLARRRFASSVVATAMFVTVGWTAAIPAPPVSAFAGPDGACDEVLNLPSGTVTVSGGQGATPDDFELLVVDADEDYALVTGPGPEDRATLASVSNTGGAELTGLCEFIEGSDEGPGLGRYVMFPVPSSASGLDASDFALPTVTFSLRSIQGGALQPVDNEGNPLGPEDLAIVIAAATDSRISIEIAGEGGEPYTRINPAEASGVVCVRGWTIPGNPSPSPSGPWVCDLLGAGLDEGDSQVEPEPFLQFDVERSLAQLDDATHLQIVGSVASAQGQFSASSAGRVSAQTGWMYFDQLSPGDDVISDIDPVAPFGQSGGEQGGGCGGPSEGDLIGETFAQAQQTRVPIPCVEFRFSSTTDPMYFGIGSSGDDGRFAIAIPTEIETGPSSSIQVLSGDYRITLVPPSGSPDVHRVAGTSFIVTWDASAGVVTHIDGQQVTAVGGSVERDLQLPLSNLQVVISEMQSVEGGQGGGQSVRLAGVEVGLTRSAWESSEWNDDVFTQYRTTFGNPANPSVDDGLAGMVVEVPGQGLNHYLLSVEDYSQDELGQWTWNVWYSHLVVASGGALYLCSERPTGDEVAGCDEIGNAGGEAIEITVALAPGEHGGGGDGGGGDGGCGGSTTGDLTGTITDSSEPPNPVECASLQIGGVDPDNPGSFWCCAGGAGSGTNGGYAFDMPATRFGGPGQSEIPILSGSYTVLVEPGGHRPGGQSREDHLLAPVRFPITWDAETGVVTPSERDVILPPSNLIVRVVDGSESALEGANVSLEQLVWEDTRWDYVPGAVYRQTTRQQADPADDGWVGHRLVPPDSGFGLYRLRVDAPEGLGLTSLQVEFAVDQAGAVYECLSTPMGDTAEIFEDSCPEVVSLSEPPTLALSAGNVTGTVTGGTNGGWVHADKVSQDCQGNGGNSTCWSFSQFDNQGAFSMQLTDGQWRLTFNPPPELQSQYVATIAEVTVSEGAVTAADVVSGGSVTLAQDSSLAVTFGTPNFLGIVVSGGVGVAEVWVSLGVWDGQMGYFQHGQGGANTSRDDASTEGVNESGRFAMALSDQFYRLEFNPPWNDSSGLVRTELIIDPVFDGATLTGINRCTAIEEGQDGSFSCAGAMAMALTDGRWSFQMPGANFSGKVCRPDTGIGDVDCQGIRDTWIELRTWDADRSFFDWSGGTNSRSGGSFGLSIPTPTGEDAVYYEVTANPPWNNTESWTRVSKVLRATSSDGNLVLELCTGDGDFPSEMCESTSAVSGPLPFALRASSQRGTVLSPLNGSAIDNSWVEVFQSDEFGGNRWINGTQTNRNGQFGLDLPQGIYTVRANPPWQGNDEGLTPGEITLVIDADGNVESPDPFVIELSQPNVVGTVRTDASDVQSTVSRAWVNVEKDNGQFLEWYPAWAETDSTGTFRLSLPEGTYRITVNPPERLNGTVSAIRETLVVTDASSIVEPIFVLGSPTLSGRVMAGTDPVPYTHIDVAVYDEFMGEFSWANLWGNTGPRGRYALNLDEGRYRLTANPGGADGYARSTTFVRVDAEGDAWRCTDGSDDTCDTTAIDGGSLDLDLASPNLTGRVTYVSDAITRGAGRSWVNVQRWNADWEYFEWVDLWAETRSNGDYALNIAEPGVYRLEFSPNPTIEALGFTRTEKFVRVEASGQWCSFASQASAVASSTCSSPEMSLDVSLIGANFAGLLQYGGAAVGDTWVGLERWNSDWNNWEWMNGGAQVSRSGTFSMRLASTSGEPELRRLTVNPPWNNPNNLGRTTVVVWVDDFDSSGGDDWCRAADASARVFTAVASSCDGGTATTDGARYTIQMAGSNVTGTLTAPDGMTGIRNSHVNVERYEDVEWSDEDQLQWYDVHANTSSTGGFALNLDEAGVYRVTGWPSWNNPNGYTRGFAEIVVENDGDWCLRSAATDDSECPTPGTSLTVGLTGSNFQAVVFQDRSFTAGQTVRDAWVDVEQRVSNGSEEYWTWTGGGAPTNSSGLVSLRLDPPTSGTREFRLSVNPPWSGSSGASLPRFTVMVTIDSDGEIVSSTPELTTNDAGRYLLGFPGASVTGNICPTTATGTGCSGSGLANSWINVFNAATGEWVDKGTSSNRRGEFRMALDDGTWTLEANPSWDNPVGMRTRVTVTVADGAVTECTGCLGSTLNPISIKLATANVTGTVRMDANRVNSWAWVEVWDGAQENIDGTGTDQNGRFQLGLADGSYVLKMFPNWSLGTNPPIEVEVTVTGGVVADWDYAGYAGADDCENDAAADTCSIAVSFASGRASSPNISGTVTVGGVATAGVFIVVRSGTDETSGPVQSQYTTVTGSSGSFSLKLPAGSYTVTALNPTEGVAHAHSNVTITGSESGPATVTLTLASS